MGINASLDETNIVPVVASLRPTTPAKLERLMAPWAGDLYGTGSGLYGFGGFAGFGGFGGVAGLGSFLPTP